MDTPKSWQEPLARDLDPRDFTKQERQELAQYSYVVQMLMVKDMKPKQQKFLFDTTCDDETSER